MPDGERIAAALALLDGIAESREEGVEAARREGRGGWGRDEVIALNVHGASSRLRYALDGARRGR